MASTFKGFRNTKQNLKTAYGRKMSSTKWLERHLNDPYVALAKAQGYRCRAAFKLKDIFEKFPAFKTAKVIVDLGCAPGGWLQVLREMTKATVVGVDLKEVEPIEGVVTIVGDFLEQSTNDALHDALGGKDVGLILSDMAANSTGDKERDHFLNVELIEACLAFAHLHLVEGGNFVVKLLRGREDQELFKTLRMQFKSVKQFKPKTSYADSTEVYLVALSFKRP